MDITIGINCLDSEKLERVISLNNSLISTGVESFKRIGLEFEWKNVNAFNGKATTKWERFNKKLDENLVVYSIKRIKDNKFGLTIYPNQLHLYLNNSHSNAIKESKEVIDMDTNFNNIKKVFEELSEYGFTIDKTNTSTVNYIKLSTQISELDTSDYSEALRIIALSNRKGSINATMDKVKIGRVKKEAKTPINPVPNQYETDTVIQGSQSFFNGLQIKVEGDSLVLSTELKYQDFQKLAKKLKIDDGRVPTDLLFTNKKCVEQLEKMALDNISYVFKNVHKQIDKAKDFMVTKFNRAEDREDVIATIGQIAYDKKGIGYIDNLLLAESIYNSSLTSKDHFNRYTKDLIIKWHKNSDSERNAIIRNTDIIEKINTISNEFGLKKYDIGLSKQTINSIKKMIKSL